MLLWVCTAVGAGWAASRRAVVTSRSPAGPNCARTIGLLLLGTAASAEVIAPARQRPCRLRCGSPSPRSPCDLNHCRQQSVQHCRDASYLGTLAIWPRTAPGSGGVAIPTRCCSQTQCAAPALTSEMLAPLSPPFGIGQYPWLGSSPPTPSLDAIRSSRASCPTKTPPPGRCRLLAASGSVDRFALPCAAQYRGRQALSLPGYRGKNYAGHSRQVAAPWFSLVPRLCSAWARRPFRQQDRHEPRCCAGRTNQGRTTERSQSGALHYFLSSRLPRRTKCGEILARGTLVDTVPTRVWGFREACRRKAAPPRTALARGELGAEPAGEWSLAGVRRSNPSCQPAKFRRCSSEYDQCLRLAYVRNRTDPRRFLKMPIKFRTAVVARPSRSPVASGLALSICLQRNVPYEFWEAALHISKDAQQPLQFRPRRCREQSIASSMH